MSTMSTMSAMSTTCAAPAHHRYGAMFTTVFTTVHIIDTDDTIVVRAMWNDPEADGRSPRAVQPAGIRLTGGLESGKRTGERMEHA